EAELGGADRTHVAGGTAADEDHVKRSHVGSQRGACRPLGGRGSVSQRPEGHVEQARGEHEQERFDPRGQRGRAKSGSESRTAVHATQGQEEVRAESQKHYEYQCWLGGQESAK